MASICGNKKLSIPAFSDKDIRKLGKRDRISPCEAIQLSTCNGPVLAWDNEDEEGNPFLPTFGYVMGMSVTRESGDLEIYVYSPESGSCLPYKRGVPVPFGFLPEMVAKVGDRFIVGKLTSIERDIYHAQLLTPEGQTYPVTLDKLVCASSLTLGLEVTIGDEAKESNSNEV